MKRQARSRRDRRAAGMSIGAIIIIAFAVVTAFFYYQLETMVAGDVFSSGGTYGNQPVKSFTLVADDFGYNGTEGGPTLVVNKGDMVEITLIGKSPVSHNLKIDEFNFMVGGEFGVQSGESDTNMFVAEESGVFKYYCRTTRLGGHESLGQVGILIVE
ncbi:MAG: hypothetical protein ACE5KU_06785 [Nitrososphaerales archaeon]